MMVQGIPARPLWERILTKWRDLRKAEVGVVGLVLRYLYYRLHGKRILTHRGVRIRGLKNIDTSQGRLEIGTNFVGFTDKTDRTLLHIEGKLVVKGRLYIGRGCRMEIGRDAVAEFGGGQFGPNSRIVIMNGLRVGARFGMSWNCELVDSNFHQIAYPGRETKSDPCIVFGDDVWLGYHVKVMPGVRLARNTVVAAHAVVTKSCDEEHVLLGGFPAKVLQRGVSFDIGRTEHR